MRRRAVVASGCPLEAPCSSGHPFILELCCPHPPTHPPGPAVVSDPLHLHDLCTASFVDAPKGNRTYLDHLSCIRPRSSACGVRPMPPHLRVMAGPSKRMHKSLEVRTNIVPHSGSFSPDYTMSPHHPGTGGETQPQCAACSVDFSKPTYNKSTYTTHTWPPPQHLSQPLERRPQSTPSQEKSWRPQSCACGAWRRCADAWLPM